MAYSDYLFYSSTYRGKSIPENVFDYYAERASEIIDERTSDKAITYDDTQDRLKKACCAVAECLHANSNVENKKSESIGNYSVSYQDAEISQNQIADKLRIYLGSTGLLYRGL